jgi:hypothetical protein
MRGLSLHQPVRPIWQYAACDDEWPCARRKDELYLECDSSIVALSLLMSQYYADAAADSPTRPPTFRGFASSLEVRPFVAVGRETTFINSWTAQAQSRPCRRSARPSPMSSTRGGNVDWTSWSWTSCSWPDASTPGGTDHDIGHSVTHEARSASQPSRAYEPNIGHGSGEWSRRQQRHVNHHAAALKPAGRAGQEVGPTAREHYYHAAERIARLPRVGSASAPARPGQDTSARGNGRNAARSE